MVRYNVVKYVAHLHPLHALALLGQVGRDARVAPLLPSTPSLLQERRRLRRHTTSFRPSRTPPPQNAAQMMWLPLYRPREACAASILHITAICTVSPWFCIVNAFARDVCKFASAARSVLLWPCGPLRAALWTVTWSGSAVPTAHGLKNRSPVVYLSKPKPQPKPKP